MATTEKVTLRESVNGLPYVTVTVSLAYNEDGDLERTAFDYIGGADESHANEYGTTIRRKLNQSVVEDGSFVYIVATCTTGRKLMARRVTQHGFFDPEVGDAVVKQFLREPEQLLFKDGKKKVTQAKVRKAIKGIVKPGNAPEPKARQKRDRQPVVVTSTPIIPKATNFRQKIREARRQAVSAS